MRCQRSLSVNIYCSYSNSLSLSLCKKQCHSARLYLFSKHRYLFAPSTGEKELPRVGVSCRAGVLDHRCPGTAWHLRVLCGLGTCPLSCSPEVLAVLSARSTQAFGMYRALLCPLSPPLPLSFLSFSLYVPPPTHTHKRNHFSLLNSHELKPESSLKIQCSLQTFLIWGV